MLEVPSADGMLNIRHSGGKKNLCAEHPPGGRKKAARAKRPRREIAGIDQSKE
jgi:hypothetical protein